MNKLKFQKLDIIDSNLTRESRGYGCTYFDDYEDKKGTGGRSRDRYMIMGYGGGHPTGGATVYGYIDGYSSLNGDGNGNNYDAGGSGCGVGYPWNVGNG